MNLKALAANVAIGVPVWIALFASQPCLDAAGGIVEGELLHTGMKITPTAALGSVFQKLNPDLAGLPDFAAGQAVATALSPDGKTLLVLTSGYNRNNGVNGSRVAAWSNEYVFIYDVTNATLVKKQVLTVPNTFNGIAWNPNGQEFYVAGGVDDNIHFFAKTGDNWAESGAPLDLGNHPSQSGGAYQPMAAGIGVNTTGDRAVVANMMYDSVTIVDLTSRTLAGEVDLRPGVADPLKAGTPGGSYPFWAVVKGDDKAYVSSQRDREIVIVDLKPVPQVIGRIAVGGLPTKMILNAAQNLLFVAESNSDTVGVIDTNTDTVVARFTTTGPANLLAKIGKFKGSNPNSVALSPDERTLYVTNGGTNSLAVVDLNYPGRRVQGKVIGLIPTGYYPNSVSMTGSTLHVVNGMSNTGPNPHACRDNLSIASGASSLCSSFNEYSWQLTKAGLLTVPVPSTSELVHLTRQVAYNCQMEKDWTQAKNERIMAAVRNQIQHVIYIVKENRTYDQVFGDLPRGNGDPNLAILSPFSPNHKKIAQTFVLLDNFYDSGTVSGDGWNWSTAARATDFTQKTVSINYAGRGLSYDWEGSNRNINVSLPGLAERKAQNPAYPNDANLLAGIGDVAAPDSEYGEAGAGYLWDAALRAGKTIRNYGFFVANTSVASSTFRNPFPNTVQAVPLNKALAPYTDPFFRGYDQNNADFWLFKEWEREFDQYVANNNLPNLSLVRLPHDHFGNFTTAIDGVNSVEKEMADNDYAIGLLIEKVANSKYKNNTLIFVLEDDAQNGGDHVDAHRSIGLVAGSMVKRGKLDSTHYTTVSMIRTMLDVLGAPPAGLNDALAEPMADIFNPFPSDWSYKAVVPSLLYSTTLPLPPQNQANLKAEAQNTFALAGPLRDAGYWQEAMKDQAFEREDELDSDAFNRALWVGLRGEDVPYPEVRSGKDLRGDRKSLLKRFKSGMAKQSMAKQSRTAEALD